MWDNYKLLAETEEENFYIRDGKNDELQVSYMQGLFGIFQMLGIWMQWQSVKQFEGLKIMEYRYENRERTANGIFFIDEFAALTNCIRQEKEFAEINDSLRRIILMGRAANIHIIMALQRPETSVVRWSD